MSMARLIPTQPRKSCERVELEALPLASIRVSGAPLTRLDRVVDELAARLRELIDRGTLAPTGPGLLIYYGDPSAALDVEVGVPLAEPLPVPIPLGEVTVEPSTLPAGPAVACTHLGPHEGIGDEWRAIIAGLADAGEAPAGIWIEVYVNQPGDGVETHEIRTDLIAPLIPSPLTHDGTERATLVS